MLEAMIGLVGLTLGVSYCYPPIFVVEEMLGKGWPDEIRRWGGEGLAAPLQSCPRVRLRVAHTEGKGQSYLKSLGG